MVPQPVHTGDWWFYYIWTRGVDIKTTIRWLCIWFQKLREALVGGEVNPLCSCQIPVSPGMHTHPDASHLVPNTTRLWLKMQAWQWIIWSELFMGTVPTYYCSYYSTLQHVCIRIFNEYALTIQWTVVLFLLWRPNFVQHWSLCSNKVWYLFDNCEILLSITKMVQS